MYLAVPFSKVSLLYLTKHQYLINLNIERALSEVILSKVGYLAGANVIKLFLSVIYKFSS